MGCAPTLASASSTGCARTGARPWRSTGHRTGGRHDARRSKPTARLGARRRLRQRHRRAVCLVGDGRPLPGGEMKDAAYQAELRHLIKLASRPGWKDYVWHKAKTLDADESGLYRGIAADLVAAMKRKQEQQQ